jgi:deoxyribodipyrimidine photo-lyase
LAKSTKLYTQNDRIMHRGGRTVGLALLKSVGTRTQLYATTRNTLSHHTSELSAYNKFGCLSIREVYYEVQAQIKGANREGLIRQLYWRDFYYRVAWYHPNVLSNKKNRNFKPDYGKVAWYSRLRTDNVSYVIPTKLALKQFKAWCEGQTGIPIVDACMRQLNTTGFMHNRGRLIVSGFLIKNLHWSWEDGELYFAKHLYDYDPAQNNGGWQWSSGSGTDSQPYFRILNPWKQGLDHDPDAIYIKQWVPELAKVPAEQIHAWYKYYQYTSVNYPQPMIDVSESVEETRKLYAALRH